MPSLYSLEHDRDVDTLVELLRSSTNPTIRKRAAEILGDLDETAEAGIDPLVTAVSDEDGRVRAAAIDALTKQDAVDALLRSLGREVPESGADWARAEAFVRDLESREPELRMAAVNVLGRLGSSGAARPLVARLDDPDVRVRQRAARALGQIGEPAVAGALAACLHDEPIPVRREAAEALGRLGGPEALDGLLSAVDDDSETMRRVVASSLGGFASTKPVDALVGLLTDESDLVRQAAVFSLISVLSNVPPDRSHELREAIVARMSARDDPSVVASLVEILEEGSQLHQRRNATWMLGRVVGERSTGLAVDALVTALGDDDDLIAQFAATGLGNLGGPTVEQALLDVLDESGDEDAVAMAAFTLGRVGGRRSRERLERLVDRTESETIRRRAFAALSKLGGH